MPVILATWEAEIRSTAIWGQPGENSSQDPISKITRAKWTGGVAQVVKHLLCKHEALSHKKKKGKKDVKPFLVVQKEPNLFTGWICIQAIVCQLLLYRN
jgi:hypothetical protein